MEVTESQSGGVTAPAGFKANGIRCGIKDSRKTADLALIVSEVPCTAAAVFTKNLVKAEPVKLSKEHIADGRAQAVIANAGNANACTGRQGYKNAVRMAESVAGVLDIPSKDVLVCSTGVIGQQLRIEAVEKGMKDLCAGLSREGHIAAREAILTTDTVYKEDEIQVDIDGYTVTIGTMAKGSGMIHINMGTMLGFITTDCAVSPDMLSSALQESVASTYNCVSIDGDTSTNDTLLILANGLAGNPEISKKDYRYKAFCDALTELNARMVKRIAADGEGASRLIECCVTGAFDDGCARNIAKSVVSSNLVKAAFFGKDANWGRILCAMGYSGSDFSPDKVSVSFQSKAGEIEVCKNGVQVDFDETKASAVLNEKEVSILISMNDGQGSGKAWGCDLTYEYVKINGDYRT